MGDKQRYMDTQQRLANKKSLHKIDQTRTRSWYLCRTTASSCQDYRRSLANSKFRYELRSKFCRQNLISHYLVDCHERNNYFSKVTIIFPFFFRIKMFSPLTKGTLTKSLLKLRKEFSPVVTNLLMKSKSKKKISR